MRVLIVEDSPHVQKPLVKALKAAGYAVDSTGDGEEGLWMAQTTSYDVLVLDLMLPGLPGMEVLRRLRSEGSETPILILSAKDTVPDRVEGLREGADDYLVKPFAVEELLARVETLSRRTYQKTSAVTVVADLEVNSAKKEARRGGRRLDLTPKQFALLEYLALREGQVVSRTEIEEHIYDSLDSPMSNVVDSAVCALRKAIAPAADSPGLIHTRRGHGYILESRGG